MLKAVRQQFPFLTVNAEIVTHTVTFKNKDGSAVLDVQEVDDGKNALNPMTCDPSSGHYIGTPHWPTDERMIYDCIGWDGTYTNVKADVVITALYRETPVRYTVRFLAGDSVVKQYTGHDEKLPDGSVNTASTGITYGSEAPYEDDDPADPTGQGRYFTGWLPEPDMITEDTDCVAQFEESISAATGVTFEDATWGQIKAIMDAGLVNEYMDAGVWWLKAGKNVELKNGEVIRLQIAATYFDTHADTGQKVPLTLFMQECFEGTQQWNSASKSFYRYKVNDTAANNATFTVNYTGGAGKVPILSTGKAILGSISVKPTGGTATVWSFDTDTDTAAGHVFSGKVEGETQTWAGLEINATTGKVERLKTEGFTWFTNGAIINVPVTGPCEIKVTTPFAGDCWNNGGWACCDLKAKCDEGGSLYLKKVYKIVNECRVLKLLSRKSKRRERQKLKKLRLKVLAGTITVKDAWQSFQSWASTAKRCRGHNAILNMQERFRRLFWEGQPCITS